MLWNVKLGLCLSFLFRVATEESTEAPNEETTAVPLGKTIKDLEKVKKICQIEAISY